MQRQSWWAGLDTVHKAQVNHINNHLREQRGKVKVTPGLKSNH